MRGQSLWRSDDLTAGTRKPSVRGLSAAVSANEDSAFRIAQMFVKKGVLDASQRVHRHDRAGWVLTILLSNGCSMTMEASPAGTPFAGAHVLPSSGET